MVSTKKGKIGDKTDKMIGARGVTGIALLGIALSIVSTVENTAFADWPERPVTIVVPFSPGGGTDQIARTFEAAFEENKLLPVPVTVINVGGHFSIGSRRVMEAIPNGYEFLLANVGLMGGEATGLTDFGYRDFKPVAATGETCMVPMVRKDSGIDDLRGLLTKARDEPNQLIFGVNLGAINHLAGIVLETAMIGAKFRFVQIGGGADNYISLTGAHTDVMIGVTSEVVNFTLDQNGEPRDDSQLKPLAYMGPKRHPGLSAIPTMNEAGFEGEFCVHNWWLAPLGTPQEAIDGFANALEAANTSHRVQSFYRTQLLGDLFMSGDELQDNLDKTWQVIFPIARQAKNKQ